MIKLKTTIDAHGNYEDVITDSREELSNWRLSEAEASPECLEYMEALHEAHVQLAYGLLKLEELPYLKEDQSPEALSALASELRELVKLNGRKTK